MNRKTQITVIGYSGSHCSSKVYSVAYESGKAIAKAGAVLITGGLDGVMEAASKGANQEGGLVLGIVPQSTFDHANSYSNIVIPSGLGYARDFLTAYSADGVIIIGGGAGTLIEACVAYLVNKPIVAIKGSGGIADKISGDYLDEQKISKIHTVDNPNKAIELLLSLIY